MTQYLPPNLLALFAARDPIPYLPPPTKLSHEKKRSGYSGIGQYVELFEDPKDTPPPKKAETKDERRERRRREKAEQAVYRLEQNIAMWTPHESATTGDPYKTLFVGRINFDTSESKLKREFESYGSVRKIVMVFDKKTGKPRGYAFVEYQSERDAQAAYKHSDGKKIDGRRVVVDIERGRTVTGWLPRRLGGGLGKTRLGGPDQNIKISGRDVDVDREKPFRGAAEREDRPPRERERETSRTRKDKKESRRRSRSKEKDSKKDRKRRRSRSHDDKEKDKRRRSRSKESKKKKRSRSREHKKDRKDREHKRDKRDKEKDEFDVSRVKVKDEPLDDYPYDEGNSDAYNDGYIKTEKQDEEEGYYEEQY